MFYIFNAVQVVQVRQTFAEPARGFSRRFSEHSPFVKQTCSTNVEQVHCQHLSNQPALEMSSTFVTNIWRMCSSFFFEQIPQTVRRVRRAGLISEPNFSMFAEPARDFSGRFGECSLNLPEWTHQKYLKKSNRGLAG